MMTNNTMMEASSNTQQQKQNFHKDGELKMDIANNSDPVTERKSLIVNYLPPTMNEGEIKALFQRVGEVSDVKLIRDKHGLFADPMNPSTRGQSLGYGFVNYLKPEDAEQAIKILNGLRLQNKTIKVSYARPSSESIKDANLYIAGLPRSMTQDELEKLFESYGTIIASKVIFYATNVKGVGFIRFDKKDEAVRAIQELNNSTPPGCTEPITVKLANSPGTKNNNSQIITSHVNHIMSRKSSGVVYNAVNKGMARFSPITTDPVIELTSNHRMKAQNYLTPQGMAPGNGWSIFVYSLPAEVEEGTLWELFGPYGAIQGVKIIRDLSTNTSKGYGFVTMINYEEAAMAIRSLNGYELGGRSLQVSFKTNKSK